MVKRHLLSVVSLILAVLLTSACASAQVSPQDQERVNQLQAELTQVDAEIAAAEEDDQTYSGGLIKTLIAVRLEILRTNRALIQQRIHALESGAAIDVVVSVAEPNAEVAQRLLGEIEGQKDKVIAAEQEAARYSGGLVQAMALSTLATQRNTLAMLEQQYYVAEYGMAMPTLSSDSVDAASSTAAPSSPSNPASECLEIIDFNSSVLDSNDVYVELAWKVDVTNSCQESLPVTTRFAIYDDDDFELDSDTEAIAVPGNGSATARGTILVSPPSKARRMTKQGASLSVR